MRASRLPLAVASVMVLVACACKSPMEADTFPGKSDQRQAGRSGSKTDMRVLFKDPMTENWQENWFLDGKEATVEHRDGGLYFSAGTITKKQDPEKYHAHHAVLWTKQVFEGDIALSFEMTRIDNSDYGAVLVYIQAQGIGVPPYEKDIYAWRELRDVPAMNKYFDYMSLLSISFRENLRCKRYPWNDVEKGLSFGSDVLLEPMYDYGGLVPGKTYRVEIEKKNPSLKLRLYDGKTGERLNEYLWDTSKNPKEQRPRFIEKGRIGLRHMSTRQHLYRNFEVRQLGGG